MGSAGSDLSVQRKRRKPKKAKAVKAERPKVEPKIEDDLESGSDVSMERGKRKKASGDLWVQFLLVSSFS